MREITLIVIHYSASPDDRQVTAGDIDEWHKVRGWDGIGYHFVIQRNGTLERGRDIETVGAHVKGHNLNSIGICVVGTDVFNDVQLETLDILLLGLHQMFPRARIRGHCELAPTPCPGMPVEPIRERIAAIEEAFRNAI